MLRPVQYRQLYIVEALKHWNQPLVPTLVIARSACSHSVIPGQKQGQGVGAPVHSVRRQRGLPECEETPVVGVPRVAYFILARA